MLSRYFSRSYFGGLLTFVFVLLGLTACSNEDASQLFQFDDTYDIAMRVRVDLVVNGSTEFTDILIDDQGYQVIANLILDEEEQLQISARRSHDRPGSGLEVYGNEVGQEIDIVATLPISQLNEEPLLLFNLILPDGALGLNSSENSLKALALASNDRSSTVTVEISIATTITTEILSGNLRQMKNSNAITEYQSINEALNRLQKTLQSDVVRDAQMQAKKFALAMKTAIYSELSVNSEFQDSVAQSLIKIVPDQPSSKKLLVDAVERVKGTFDEEDIRPVFQAGSATIKKIEQSKIITKKAEETKDEPKVEPVKKPSNPVDPVVPSLPQKPGIGDAPVRFDNLLGNFIELDDSLPFQHEHGAAIQIGNKLYLIGGSLANPGGFDSSLNSGTTDAVFVTSIDANGLPTDFSLSPYRLTVPRKGSRAEIIGDYLYVFGGFSSSGQSTSTPLATIERAPIDEQGVSGNFELVSQTLATGRYNFLTLVTPAYIYAIGGGVSSNYQSNTIERASLNPITGEFGDFVALDRQVVEDGQVIMNGLVNERWTHTGLRLGNNFYILGGEGDRSVEKVVIQSDGSLGSFQMMDESHWMNQSRNRLHVIPLLGRVYVMGGWSGGFLRSVESAPIVNNELGEFTVEGEVELVFGVENVTSLLTSAGFFLFGGYDGSTRSEIQFAPLIDP